jgi:acyl-[acyl carrier protein]--UDP-N-acetylglucosamine O-acyltransferase
MISPLAQVDPKAKIANNVTIDAFSVVMVMLKLEKEHTLCLT